jgi:hypothetical protein
MADRTATDEAIDLIVRHSFGYLDKIEARSLVNALPAELLHRLATEKGGGPLFEGVAMDLMVVIDPSRRVVVYPAPETTK